MHRLVRALRKASARRRSGQAGFTVIEVVVAMTVLAVALMALGQLAGAQIGATLRNHIRQSAISYVNQELESIRSMSYVRIGMDPNPTDGTTAPGSSYTVPTSGGATFSHPVTGTAGCGTTTCLDFERTTTLTIGQQSPTAETFNFTEYRWIDQQPSSTYKTVVIVLVSTSGPAFTYASQTDVNGLTTNTPTPINELEIDFQAVNSAGTALTNGNGDPYTLPDGFTISVTGASSTSGTSADNTWFSTTLAAGSYTCTVSNSSNGWVTYPGASSSTSFPCTDPGGYNTQWQQLTCADPTVDTNGAFNSLTVHVVDTDGTGISGEKVHLTASSGHQKGIPGDQNTNAQGVATFSNVAPGWYTINGGAPGGYFQDPNNATTFCMWNGTSSTNTTSSVIYITLAANSGGQQKATVNVSVQNNNSTGGWSEMEVLATANDGSGDAYYDQESMNAGAAAATFSFNVAGGSTYNGTYTVAVWCVGSDGVKLSQGTSGTTWSWTTPTMTNNLNWTPTGNSSSAPATLAC